tara:strand:- start:930 stop:1124 length:195 start_codon:yes stop_codon:yes gene_type:complete
LEGKKKGMGLIIGIILFGGGLGYFLSARRKGNYLDKLQYIGVFSIISLITAVLIQIALMRMNFF